MKLLTWKILLPSECGCRGEEKGADATAYLLDWREGDVKKKRPAVVICPGGGYSHLSQREGEPVAMQYLSMGYHAFVLRYRVAPARFPEALWELALLVSQIREHSEEWEVDPERIMVSGFSAGGHLAGSLGTFWNREFVYGPLGRGKEDIRPDGMILAYPVVTSGPYCHKASFENLLGEESNHKEKRELVSLELQVNSFTPKTFLWHTASDGTVPVQNSLLLADALVRNNVSLEFHLFPSGPHGLALATEDTCGGRPELVELCCQPWIALAGEWLKRL